MAQHARAVEEILARGGAEQFVITMFGDEPYGNDNRIMPVPGSPWTSRRFIPRIIANSYKATGGVSTALGSFCLFYVVCVAVTYLVYLRRSFSMSQAKA